VQRDKILTVILLFSILASIAILIYLIITPKQGERFTEFYILGEKGKAADYPTSLRVNETSKVIVGIINHEYALTNYTLQLRLDGEVLLQRDVALEHNSTWEEKVYFTPKISGDNLKLEFLLYREGNFTAPYRDLHLWVKVI
jgi:uncharacterized membrane protein